MDEILKMAELISAELSKEQLSFIVNYILENYWYFTISDITALTVQVMRERPYGKPLLQNIIVAIDSWDVQRQNYAIDQRIKESSKLKADTITNKELEILYEKLKKEVKETPTQKEKDMANTISNQEKTIELLDKLYPND